MTTLAERLRDLHAGYQHDCAALEAADVIEAVQRELLGMSIRPNGISPLDDELRALADRLGGAS